MTNENTGEDEFNGADSWSSDAGATTVANTDTTSETEETTEDNSEQQSEWKMNGDRNEVEPEIIDDATGRGEATEKTSEDNEKAIPFDADETIEEYIELGITQVNYTTRELADGSERAVIHMFCRDPSRENKQVRVDVYGFKPYFYTTKREADSINVQRDNRFYDKSYSDEEYGEFTSIRGKKLARVKAHIPRTVGSIRDDYEHYEADVLFPDRFLIDNGISSGVRVPANWADKEDKTVIQVQESDVEPVDVDIKLRVHNMDIEVNDRNGFPEPEDAEEKIISITAHDEWDGNEEYTVWYLDTENVMGDIPRDVSGYEFIEEQKADEDKKVERPDVNIRTFDSEVKMLLDYASYLEKTEADLFVGWNVEDFDATYLVNRMEKLDEEKADDRDLSPDRLSEINEVWSGGWKGPNIKGRVVFDLLEAYKRTKFSALDSYRLEAVGKKELDVGKERYDGDIGDLWEENPERLIEYNLRDVEILVELDRKQNIIGFWDEVRQYVGCRIQDAPIPGDAVDMYVLHKAHNRFVLPSKGEVESGEEFEGGAVFDPMTGIEENVTVLDLKSLYPMCMTTINASPETKVDDDYDGDVYVAPNGTKFRKEPDGMMREMVEELLAERDEKKELRSEYDPDDEMYKMYDRQQASVKVIMNSLYGVSGWDRFRLYDKDNAAAVTATGREVINFTEKVVNEMGYEVAYGDTDSVMISLGDLDTSNVEVTDELREERNDLNEEQLKEIQAALNQSHKIEDEINNRYNEFAEEQFNTTEHNFLIEFEKLYRRFIQAGRKKRYGGHIIWKEGKYVDDIDITGFEYQRSDIAEVTKRSQKRLIEMLVKGEDIDNVKTYLREVITDFQEGNISLSDIGIPSGIGKNLNNYDSPTAHVRGAKYANMLIGTNFGQGSKPKRVYIKRVDPSFYQKVDMEPQENELYREFKRDPDVFCFIHDDQVPNEFEVALDKMLQKTLQKPLSRVLKAVDVTWEDVKTGKEQKGLESFM